MFRTRVCDIYFDDLYAEIKPLRKKRKGGCITDEECWNNWVRRQKRRKEMRENKA